MNVAVLDEAGTVVNVIVIAEDVAMPNGCVAYTPENPAYIGGPYIGGVFYPPQPFPSWTAVDGRWQPPTPRPTEGVWYWDEDTTSWVEVPALT